MLVSQMNLMSEHAVKFVSVLPDLQVVQSRTHNTDKIRQKKHTLIVLP